MCWSPKVFSCREYVGFLSKPLLPLFKESPAFRKLQEGFLTLFLAVITVFALTK